MLGEMGYLVYTSSCLAILLCAQVHFISAQTSENYCHQERIMRRKKTLCAPVVMQCSEMKDCTLIIASNKALLGHWT